MYNLDIFKRNFYYKGRYWCKNIKNIPRYFRQLHFLVKNGYDISAHWSVDHWFIEVMKHILTGLKEEGNSYPCQFEDIKEWHEILSEMINLLDEMCEDNYDYGTLGFKEVSNRMDAAKSRFFELFSEHFYNLWD